MSAVNKAIQGGCLVVGLIFGICGWGNTATFFAVTAIYSLLEDKL